MKVENLVKVRKNKKYVVISLKEKKIIINYKKKACIEKLKQQYFVIQKRKKS